MPPHPHTQSQQHAAVCMTTGIGPSLSRDDIQLNMMRQFKGREPTMGSEQTVRPSEISIIVPS